MKTTEIGKLYADAMKRRKIDSKKGAKLLDVTPGFFSHVKRGSVCALISDRIVEQSIKKLGIPATKLRKIVLVHNDRVRAYRKSLAA